MLAAACGPGAALQPCADAAWSAEDLGVGGGGWSQGLKRKTQGERGCRLSFLWFSPLTAPTGAVFPFPGPSSRPSEQLRRALGRFLVGFSNENRGDFGSGCLDEGVCKVGCSPLHV